MADYSYKDRVRREYNELDARCMRLRVFVQADSVYGSLPMEEQSRLSDQLYHMEQYVSILRRRIAWFDRTETPCDDNPTGK